MKSIAILGTIIVIILSGCRYCSNKTTTNVDSGFNNDIVVKGESMSPTFHDSERLVILNEKGEYQKGDILVLNCRGLNETIIKRCIGTGRDKIRINYNENSVEVNGKLLSNDYIKEPMIDKATYNQQYCVSSGVYEYTVPDGKFFVMGDNRNGSSDSRSSLVGFIDVKDVLGKVVVENENK